mgnify:CR=1 FL=1
MLTTLQRIPQRKSCYSTSKRIGAERKRIVHFLWLRGKCRCRWKMAWERCSRDEIHIQTATGPPVIAEGYQDSDRTTGLGSQDGIVPDKVSDREAGTNRSGNTGRTRLLYINREGVFLYPGFQRLKCCSCLHDNP